MPKKRIVLKLLHQPTGAASSKGSSPAVDVVLVHGLDGDPTKTWTDPSSGVLWPQALLPQEFPSARVLSFGYNADMYLNRSKAGIRSNAESLLAQLKARRAADDPNRPIVFVAHCLGGLIVKQLLSFANHDHEKHGVIGDATKAILFFGTPNNAVDKDQWELLAKAYAPMERQQRNGEGGQLSGLVLALTRDARDLAEVNEDFVHISDRYPIFSFFETEMWEKTNACIVDEQAARMFVDNEEGLPVGANHVEMCQIEDAEDETFVNICRCIKQALVPGPSETEPEGSVASERCSVADDESPATPVAADESPNPKVADGSLSPKVEKEEVELESWMHDLIHKGKSRGPHAAADEQQAFQDLFVHDSKMRAHEEVKVKVQVSTGERNVTHQVWELSDEDDRNGKTECRETVTVPSAGWQSVPAAGVTWEHQQVFSHVTVSESTATQKKTSRGKKFFSSVKSGFRF